MSLHGNGWNPTSITRAVSKYGTATDTVRVETELGEGFLKALGNPAGPHALACEFVGSCVADWIGLPTFDFSIVDVSDPEEIVIEGKSCADPGPAFISKAVDSGFTWGGDEHTIDSISNPEDISRLVVVDTWLRNCDRYSPDGRRINRSNVFFQQKIQPHRRLELIAMDFTHAFTCGQPLDRRLGHIERIRDEQIYGLFPEFRQLLSRDQVALTAARLATFSAADANRITALVPHQWIVDGALKGIWNKFMIERAHFLAANVERMLWPENAKIEFQEVPNEL